MCNFLTRLYTAEGVTPEITAVSEFLGSLLGADCAGEKELMFLTLRVSNRGSFDAPPLEIQSNFSWPFSISC